MKRNFIFFFKNLLRLAVTIALSVAVLYLPSLLSHFPFSFSMSTFSSILFIFFSYPAFIILIGIFGWYKPFRKGNINIPDSSLFRYLHFFLLVIFSIIYALFRIGTSKSGKISAPDFSIVFIIIVIWESFVFFTFLISYLIGLEKADIPFGTNLRYISIPIVIIALLLIAIPWSIGYRKRNLLPPNGFSFAPSLNDISYYVYNPFTGSNYTPQIDFEPFLMIDNDYPRLAGDTISFPVYTAFAESVYTELDEENASEYIQHTTTHEAYSLLIGGECDLIFCFGPNEEEIKIAQNAGLELILTPIFQDAFVFFVNENNPVENLSHEQIKHIYQKKIKNWSKVGGLNKRILAFQKDENPEIQEIMLNEIMQGAPITEPLIKTQTTGNRVSFSTARFQNEENALGYSYRYHIAVINEHVEIRLLNVNGISPEIENIKNNTYPFIIPVYAVTTNEGLENPNTQKIIDWFTSSEGQYFIEQCGYVPK